MEMVKEVVAGRIGREFVQEEGRICSFYLKFERDKNCIFRVTNSLGIKADILEQVDYAQINLTELNTIVRASRREIKAYKDVKVFHGETRYYYPCKRWKVISGNPLWYQAYVK